MVYAGVGFNEERIWVIVNRGRRYQNKKGEERREEVNRMKR